MPERVLLLQDTYEVNDMLNPSLFALMALFPDADVGFLQNKSNALPPELQERRTEFFAARLSAKALKDLDTLVGVEATIPIENYDLVICNTRGALGHLRKKKSKKPRIIVYYHDLLPFLWRQDNTDWNEQESNQLLRWQEIDLEFSQGIDTAVAAQLSLRQTLATMQARDVHLAYPLVDQDLFYPDIETPREYFLATDSTDLETLMHIAACVTDKLVVLGEYRYNKLFRELKPDNIFYTGEISVAEKAYYLAGAKAFFCGAAHELDHLPLAALKSGIPIIAHPSQGMREFLTDADLGFELETGSAEELLHFIRYYRNKNINREKNASELDWLNYENFSRRWKKILKGI